MKAHQQFTHIYIYTHTHIYINTLLSILTYTYASPRYAEAAHLDPTNSSFQNSSLCVAGHNNSADSVQDRVQQQSADFTMYRSIALNIPSMFFMPMWGALSDVIGRKVRPVPRVGVEGGYSTQKLTGEAAQKLKCTHLQ